MQRTTLRHNNSLQLAIPPPGLGSVVLPHKITLATCLGESKAPLLTHPADLANLANGALERGKLGPVILDVVLLDTLDLMVHLWVPVTLVVLPEEVTEKAEDRDDDDGQPVGRGPVDVAENTPVLERDACTGGDDGVERECDEPHEERARDGEQGELGPLRGDEGGLSE